MTIELENLAEQPPSVLDSLPIEVLANLKDQADAHLADASQMVAILHGVFQRRYVQGINAPGTSHRTDGGYDIKVTVPKRVEWDQERIANAVATITDEWGEDPANYVDTKITVKESAYNAWPPVLRDLFSPARTVKAGKPKFEVRAAQMEVA